ncbi:sulfonate ABC transporter substrate-binding protein [Amantichitinum ursilacus]|uniref:Putative aliphatic sulfonates-binding protein n=1 Tax=Amantichitinum ursilacus TaxID=857265 RepID=A0A0N0GKZ8_9NEIS|nr:sulfonate ABC transporter substrate-binding protein [Amantichitinum ursilacus]KPC49315.1 putative aliphatic sulfonates-binding protein precursor [Amantichitinum ursilacus]
MRSIRSVLTHLGLALSLSAVSLATHADELRIGFQKSSFNLIVLKSRGTLETKLGAGTSVRWVEFPAGPQLLEALNAGSVDFGMTGDTPPIFAQSAGSRLVYVGFEPPKPQASALLIPKNSAIKTLADLKGKRVAIQKGSSSHGFLLRLLDKAGLKWEDIQPQYLAPADARAAFERGAVDAWAIWDPYYAAAEKSGSAKVLLTAEGISPNQTFYLANRDFAKANAPLLNTVFEELTRNSDYIEQHPKDTAHLLSAYVGLDQATFEQVLARRPSYRVSWLDDKTIVEQQRLADRLTQAGLIPKAVTVADIVVRH